MRPPRRHEVGIRVGINDPKSQSANTANTTNTTTTTTTKPLLDDSQLGGRKQQSAIDTALLLLHHIESKRSEVKSWKRPKLVTSTVFLDIKGAFDHVNEARLVRILIELGLPPIFIS